MSAGGRWQPGRKPCRSAILLLALVRSDLHTQAPCRHNHTLACYHTPACLPACLPACPHVWIHHPCTDVPRHPASSPVPPPLHGSSAPCANTPHPLLPVAIVLPQHPHLHPSTPQPAPQTPGKLFAKSEPTASTWASHTPSHTHTRGRRTRSADLDARLRVRRQHLHRVPRRPRRRPHRLAAQQAHAHRHGARARRHRHAQLQG